MDTITELTEKKIKQVTFKILEQAGVDSDSNQKSFNHKLSIKKN
jgi:hypothetical protein